MGQEQVKFKIVYKRYRSERHPFKHYLLLTIALLAFSFVMIYLNSINVWFASTLILVFIILPLIVVFSEYTALIESGAPAPPNTKAYFGLYKNTYRSGRLRHFINFRNILIYILFLFVGIIIAGLGLTLFIYLFDKPVYAQMQTFMQEFAATSTPDAINVLVANFETVLEPYLPSQIIANNLISTLALIIIVVKGVFNIYLSIFIEHRPTTSFIVLRNTFIDDKATKKSLRGSQNLLIFIIFLVYALFVVGGYFLVRAINPDGALFLQANLFGVIVLAFSMPLVTRFTFYLYHAIMADKRAKVLRFAIFELREIIKNPNIPEQTKDYLTQVLKIRESEYAALTAIDAEHKVVEDTNTEREEQIKDTEEEE